MNLSGNRPVTCPGARNHPYVADCVEFVQGREDCMVNLPPYDDLRDDRGTLSLFLQSTPGERYAAAASLGDGIENAFKNASVSTQMRLHYSES